MLQQLTGLSFQQIEAAEGVDSAALAEAQILEQTCTLGRAVISTIGGGAPLRAAGGPSLKPHVPSDSLRRLDRQRRCGAR